MPNPKPKRTTNLSLPPPKRIRTSPSPLSTTTPISRPARSLQSILSLPEDAIYSLPKQLLREYFLTLQSYARAPYPLLPSLPSPITPLTTTSPSLSTSCFLRLPLEIRMQIYKYLLPAASTTPIKGPHPRQLQSAIHLTQPILPSLLLLNQQIRTEVLPVFYGAESQVVHVVVDYKLWEHKMRRSELVLSSALVRGIRHLCVDVHLGSEKRPLASSSSSSHPQKERDERVEADARLAEVKKGIKKLGKWLAGAEIESLRVGWQEPPCTFCWEQKRDVLEGLRGLRAMRVGKGVINWGLEGWNRGRRYRFEEGWERGLERGED